MAGTYGSTDSDRMTTRSRSLDMEAPGQGAYAKLLGSDGRDPDAYPAEAPCCRSKRECGCCCVGCCCSVLWALALGGLIYFVIAHDKTNHPTIEVRGAHRLCCGLFFVFVMLCVVLRRPISCSRPSSCSRIPVVCRLPYALRSCPHLDCPWPSDQRECRNPRAGVAAGLLEEPRSITRNSGQPACGLCGAAACWRSISIGSAAGLCRRCGQW